jgi:hypothetical protein
LGQPVVPNGIPLSKIHHAAFDAHLIGIDPDYRLHVSERLLMQKDGPMLQALKWLNGGTIHRPKRVARYCASVSRISASYDAATRRIVRRVRHLIVDGRNIRRVLFVDRVISVRLRDAVILIDHVALGDVVDAADRPRREQLAV